MIDIDIDIDHRFPALFPSHAQISQPILQLMRSATHALSRRLATSEYPTLSTKYYIYELLWNSRFELNDEWPFVRW